MSNHAWPGPLQSMERELKLRAATTYAPQQHNLTPHAAWTLTVGTEGLLHAVSQVVQHKSCRNRTCIQAPCLCTAACFLHYHVVVRRHCSSIDEGCGNCSAAAHSF